MQLGTDSGIKTHPETLLERAVRRELARLDQIRSDHDRNQAEKRPRETARIDGRVRTP